jgi:hypothetical protein
MRKALLFILCFSVPILGQALENYNGWGDTISPVGFKADALKFGTPHRLSPYENTALITMANDTGHAGLTGDSIQFEFGYQRGYIVINSNGKADTTWGPAVIVDTFNLSNTVKIILPAGTTTTTDTSTMGEGWLRGMIDTSYVTGYAVMVNPICPYWAPLIRPWAYGFAGNRKATYVKLVFIFQRRIAQSVREQ